MAINLRENHLLYLINCTPHRALGGKSLCYSTFGKDRDFSLWISVTRGGAFRKGGGKSSSFKETRGKEMTQDTEETEKPCALCTTAEEDGRIKVCNLHRSSIYNSKIALAGRMQQPTSSRTQQRSATR